MTYSRLAEAQGDRDYLCRGTGRDEQSSARGRTQVVTAAGEPGTRAPLRELLDRFAERSRPSSAPRFSSGALESLEQASFYSHRAELCRRPAEPPNLLACESSLISGDISESASSVKGCVSGSPPDGRVGHAVRGQSVGVISSPSVRQWVVQVTCRNHKSNLMQFMSPAALTSPSSTLPVYDPCPDRDTARCSLASSTWPQPDAALPLRSPSDALVDAALVRTDD